MTIDIAGDGQECDCGQTAGHRQSAEGIFHGAGIQEQLQVPGHHHHQGRPAPIVPEPGHLETCGPGKAHQPEDGVAQEWGGLQTREPAEEQQAAKDEQRVGGVGNATFCVSQHAIFENLQ